MKRRLEDRIIRTEALLAAVADVAADANTRKISEEDWAEARTLFEELCAEALAKNPRALDELMQLTEKSKG